MPHDPPIGHASAGVMSLPAQGRGEPTPRSRALLVSKVGLTCLHSQSSIRFLFLLCGALFHQALGGFLLRIFLCVHCLAHNGLLGLEGTIGILRQSEQIRVIGKSANSEQAARRRGGSADACAARSAPNQSGLSRTLACPRRFAPGAPRLELGTPCTTYFVSLLFNVTRFKCESARA